MTFGPGDIFIFVAAMLVGMALFRLVPADWPQASFRREPQAKDA
jgi:hypothetical protein